MKLYFDVSKNILKKKNNEIITSYSNNTNKCYFHCTKKWSDIYKYALFTDVNNRQYVIDLGIGSKVECYIPSEALKGNYFSISVFGDNRYTTTQQTILVRSSGFSDKTEQMTEQNDDDDDCFINDIGYDYDSLFWNFLLLKHQLKNKETSSELSTVAKTGSFNDLKDIPEEFNPSSHTHHSSDIVDLDDTADYDLDIIIEKLIENIENT